MRSFLLIFSAVFLSIMALSACGGEPPSTTIRDVSLLTDTTDTSGPYRVSAEILDRRGVTRAYVFWRTSVDEEPLRSRLESDGSDVFMGGIDGQPVGTLVSWWIVAEAEGGALTFEPPAAPDENWRFEILPGGTDSSDDPGGSTSDTPDEPSTDESICDTIECEPGEICLPRGECVPDRGCFDSDDCEVGLVCRDGRCDPVRDQPNESCGTTSDCSEGLTCRFGECVPEECFRDADCPSAQRCLFGECFGDDAPVPDSCRADSECGDGEQCLVGVCVPRVCSSSSDCPDEQSCLRGFCVPFDLPIPDELLRECQFDRDCPNIPGIIETQCVLGLCLPGDLLPVPIPDGCEDRRDCPPGQTCLARLCVDAQCQRNADCGPREECTFGQCTPAGIGDGLPGGGGGDTPPLPGGCETDADCSDGDSCLFGFCLPFSFP